MLLTQTFESAVRELMFLAGGAAGKPFAHKHIAAQLGESPTYMAKVTSLLVKANILRSHRGATGGVTLNRPPDAITLLSVLEACQGSLVGDYCQETNDLSAVCTYHLMGVELHAAVTEILSRWTLGKLMERPLPLPNVKGQVACRLEARRTSLAARYASADSDRQEKASAENGTNNQSNVTKSRM